MKIYRKISELRNAITDFKSRGQLGLVTTMGALHAGHMSLMTSALKDNDFVVATIFVNPTQFGEAKDLDAYPRTEDADLDKLRKVGVDAVFIPDVSEMYPDGAQTIVKTTRLADILHGKVRPGHFEGVTTIVNKLFNIVSPDAAYFGEKDYQQLAVIKQMTRDLFMPIKVIGVKTVREEDGLALSSRNVRLSHEDRKAAPVLHQSLLVAEKVIQQGGTIEDAKTALKACIDAEPRALFKAADFVDAESFDIVTGKPDRKIGVMLSAQFGDILLIDQKEILV